jgi:Zn-dependent metalloprotease
MSNNCLCLNCITPPHLLQKLLTSKNEAIRQSAFNTLLATARLRGERSVRAAFGVALASGDARRTLFDCQNGVFLQSAVVVRSEDGAPSSDASVNQAFEGLGKTREFYAEIFERNSIDGNGMRLDGYVHRGFQYNNAFWDGQEMVFGDGDGILFSDFTGSLDVIAHELAHGVTEHTAGLEYHNQPGALNESMSDVFGSLVKQWALDQTADVADWLIGSEIFTPDVDADALRSLKAPGTAYDSEMLGKDPQPDHMSKFVNLPDTDEGDNGGVHINSGIPNKAFYLAAMEIGGYAWDAPGLIWYEALKGSNVKTNFQEFADTTYLKAEQHYGANSVEQNAVVAAWRGVGIRITGTPGRVGPRRDRKGGRGRITSEDSFGALTEQIAGLAEQLKALSKDVAALKRSR